MRFYLLFSLFFLLLTGCLNTSSWKPDRTIDLGDITPIGIVAMGDHLWLSDGDNNRIIELNKEGEILQKIEGFERPMHISSVDKKLLIPEYGSDKIVIYQDGKRSNLNLMDSLDAPAAIDAFLEERAIADFYNHRILFYNGKKWLSFGVEGKKDGQFNYPTDVHISSDKIYVADAYNNRIQAFDKNGKFLQSIGADQGINAATGLYVSDKNIFATDFENNRVLVFDLLGEIQQILDEGLSKPTDLIIKDDLLYIINYKGKNIQTYKL